MAGGKNAELTALLRLQDQMTKPLDGVVKSFGKLAGALPNPVKALGSLSGALGNVAQMAAGFALGGVLTNLPGQLFNMAKGAMEDAAATARLGQTINNLGGDFAKISGQVDAAIRTGQKLAFSDDDVRDSFQSLANATGNADEALRRQRIAMDFARGANIPLAQATKLLGKLNEDNIEVFKRMGIVIGENATEADALRIVQEKFGGQAETFARSGAGLWERSKIALSEIGESIGSIVLPAFLAIGEVLADNLPAIQEWLGGVSDDLRDTFGTAFQEIWRNLQGFIGWLTTGDLGWLDDSALQDTAKSLQGVRDVVVGFIDMLPDLATAAQQAIGFFLTGSGDIEMFRGVLNKLVGPEGTQGVIEVFTNLTGFFHTNLIPAFQAAAAAGQQALSGDLMGALQTAGAGLLTFGQGLATSLLEWGRRFVEWVAPMIPPLLAELQVLAERLFAWIKEQTPGFTEKLIAEWIPAFIDWVGKSIVPLLIELGKWQGRVLVWIFTEGVPAMIRGAIELGGAIVQGVVRGVQRLWPDLQAAMSKMATDAINAAKAAIGARSPSQMAEDEVGVMIPLGVAAGVRKAAPVLNAAVRDVLVAAIEEAEIALVGLADQVQAAEDVLGDMEKGLKPLQKALDLTTKQVDALKDAIGGLQGEMGNIAGGGILLPGEKEIRENIFGLKNAINILEQQKRELIRGGASKDDPAVKAIDAEIKRNRDELAFQEGKLKAEYDGQRHALEEAARAGTEITQTFEQQYERIVKIKELLAKLNAEELPQALAAQEAARKEMEAAKLAIEGQKEIVDLLKEDYDALKEQSKKWKDELVKVAQEAKKIRDRLREAMDLKDKLKDSAVAATRAPASVAGSMAAAAMVGGARPLAGMAVGGATVTIYQTIDNRNNTAQAVTTQTLDALARARVIAGTVG